MLAIAKKHPFCRSHAKHDINQTFRLHSGTEMPSEAVTHQRPPERSSKLVLFAALRRAYLAGRARGAALGAAPRLRLGQKQGFHTPRTPVGYLGTEDGIGQAAVT